MKKVRLLIGLAFLLVISAACQHEQELGEIGKVSSESNMTSKKDVYKVVIDPGHGGEDPGATGVSGSYEKDFTLSLAKKVSQLLEKEEQLQVYMTRQEDAFLSAEKRERPHYANSIPADLYVSIHANTFEDSSVSGTETYYYDRKSKALANIMHQSILEATGFKDRGVRKEDYFVLKDTTMPAVLLEVGYITNPENEGQMLKDDFQQQVAEAIVSGIKNYLIE